MNGLVAYATNNKGILDNKYGPGNWGKGASSEYNKIVKGFNTNRTGK
ncbi:hypothetical protein FACS1894182_08460 [Bacteroidia bacterium]|nr:hypothetical protein FACS1894182_08460 [Bacteroidia bacterium]